MTNSVGGRLDLLYVGTLPPHTGGSAVVAAQLLGELAAMGHRVRSLAPLPVGERDDAFARSRPALHVTRYSVPYLESALDRLADDAYRQLERAAIHATLPPMIARRRPDAVIVGRESFARHVPEIVRAHGLPAVLIVHGGRTFGRVVADGCDADTARVRAGFRAVDRIITVARHLADRLTSPDLPPVEVIPNPVDLEHFSPGAADASLRRALAIPPGHTVLLHVSKLASVKRPLDLVASARRALARHPRLTYIVVGDGPLREAMERACAEQDLADRVRFVGWVDHRLVRDYMRLADLVVMPSETEGQSLVHLECMACGCVLLASDLPATREIVRDGATGILFPCGDVEALAAKTLWAAARPERRREIGRQARDQVLSHGLQATAGTYVTALEGVRRRFRERTQEAQAR